MHESLSVTIRPYANGDVDRLFEAVNESRKELGRWLPWCHPDYSISDSRSWVEGRGAAFEAGAEYAFVVCGADGSFLGGCGLNQIDRNHRRANLGYWIRSTRTGLGAATGAVRQLARWAFLNTDLVRLEIVAAVGNAPSQRVAEKSGAVREGVARSRLFLHAAANDAVVYSFVRIAAGSFLT